MTTASATLRGALDNRDRFVRDKPVADHAAPISAMGSLRAVQRYEREQAVPLHEALGRRPTEEAALARFIEQFACGGAILPCVARGIVTPGVEGVSAHVALALAGALDTPHSSVDVFGAGNIDHLAAVLQGVLARAADNSGRPLSQAEVDKLAVQTVLTDATGKGRLPADLADMPPAPLTDRRGKPLGATGADFWRYALDQQAEWEVSEMRFMGGTLMHGIPAFATIERVVRRAGMSAEQAQAAYECVIGHHMSGFVAAGFAKAGIGLHFAAMIARGELRPATGWAIQAVYEAAIPLAGHWRNKIDRRPGPALTPDERRRYADEARALRIAVAALPEHVASQFANDDTAQFTRLGIEKWLGMMQLIQKPDSTAALLCAVFAGPAQDYYEENLARGTGETFARASDYTASRLGFCLADPEDGEHGDYFRELPAAQATGLAWQLVHHEPLRQAYLEERGLQALPEPVRQRDVGDLVEWLRARSPVPAELARLAGVEAGAPPEGWGRRSL